MSAIRFDNVWKEYGDHIVLERITLDVAPRAFVALVGPSGCGKTTFLRMLLGEETPTRGQILIDGQPMPSEPDADRGVVFQRYSVFPHLTVLDNVLLGRELQQSRLLGRLFGRARREATEQALALLDEVGLKGHESKYPSALSGGMQQRLALAQAIMRGPKILLLDEPFGALDAKVRKELRAWLRNLHEEIHVTSIFVTHDQEEALEVANRVVVMDKGRIEQIGSPGDVYERPASAFVHGFIGESIVLPVEVRDGRVRLGDRDLDLTAQDTAAGPSKLFVRRHDVTVGPSGSGVFEGAVKAVRAFGPMQRADIVLSGLGGDTLIEIDAPRDHSLKVGDRIGLHPQRYRIFADR